MQHFQELIFLDVAVSEDCEIKVSVDAGKPTDEGSELSEMQLQLFFLDLIHSTKLVESYLNEFNLIVKTLLNFPIILVKAVVSHLDQSLVDLDLALVASNIVDSEFFVDLNNQALWKHLCLVFPLRPNTLNVGSNLDEDVRVQELLEECLVYFFELLKSLY